MQFCKKGGSEMTKPLGEKAQRTREHILAQGMALMKEKGFQGTTIRDICEAAEVSVGTFYAYFHDKGELFRYNFQEKGPAFADFLTLNIVGDTAYEQIMSFVRYYAWLNIGTPKDELERIFLRPDEQWFPGNNPAYNVLYTVILAGQERSEITDKLDANQIVDMIRVFLRGCIYEWIMGGCSFDLEERLCFYVSQLVRAFIL